LKSNTIAIAISYIFNASFYSIYLLPIFVDLKDIFTIALSIIFLGIMPIIFIVIQSIRGRIDMFVSQRKERPKYFIPALIGYLTGYILFSLLNKSMLALYHLTYFTVTFTIFLISFKWKISVHMAGICGPNTFIILTLGEKYIPLYLLSILVGWARYRLKAHTFLQLFMGGIIAIVVTFFTVIYMR